MASAKVEPASTSDLTTFILFDNALFSTCSVKISNEFTKVKPALTIVANCR
ncbi:hypothetical protein ES705_36383 [subsurface metagenome]